jgi:hypothetical protein
MTHFIEFAKACVAALLSRNVILLGAIGLIACGDEDKAFVTVSYSTSTLLLRDSLTVTLTDGKRTRRLTGSAISSSLASLPELKTATNGTLRMAFRFAAGQRASSEGAIEVPLQPDWGYGFHIRVDTMNYMICMGCMGQRAFPIDPSLQRYPKDSIRVTWGGNYISNPVVY